MQLRIAREADAGLAIIVTDLNEVISGSMSELFRTLAEHDLLVAVSPISAIEPRRR